MKYLLIVLIAIVTAFGFMIYQSNTKRAELAAQADAYKQQQIQSQIALDRMRSERDAESKTKEIQSTKPVEQKNVSNTSGQSMAQSIHSSKDPNIIKVEEKVKAMLKDPMSAVFKDQKGNCGAVNAKNGFGGYTGFDRFIYYPDTDHVLMESSSSDAIVTPEIMDKIWPTKCS